MPKNDELVTLLDRAVASLKEAARDIRGLGHKPGMREIGRLVEGAQRDTRRARDLAL